MDINWILNMQNDLETSKKTTTFATSKLNN